MQSSIAGALSSVGQSGIVRKIVASAEAVTNTSASLSYKQPIVGSLLSTTSVSATVLLRKVLSVSLSASSSTSISIKANKQVQSASFATSTITAVLSKQISIYASCQATSSCYSTMSLAKSIGLFIPTTSSANSNLTFLRGLQGLLASGSSVDALINNTSKLSLTGISDISNISARCKVIIGFFAQIRLSSIVSCDVRGINIDRHAEVLQIGGRSICRSRIRARLYCYCEMNDKPTLRTFVNNLRRNTEYPSGKWKDFNKTYKESRMLKEIARRVPNLLPPKYLNPRGPRPKDYK